MACQDWSQEFEPLLGPQGLGPWLRDCLSTRGLNQMQTPLVTPMGSQEVPSLRGDDRDPVTGEPRDSRTGIYFVPGGVGISIRGWERFRMTCQGLALGGRLYDGTLAVDNLTADQVYQLPNASGTIALTHVISKINAEAFTIQAGQPVTLSGTTDCVLALADAYATCAVGLARVIAGAGTAVEIVLSGTYELVDWTLVINSVSLTPGNEYFTSHATPGSLTDISPDTDGLFSQYVGKALSPTVMDIRVERPYEL